MLPGLVLWVRASGRDWSWVQNVRIWVLVSGLEGRKREETRDLVNGPRDRLLRLPTNKQGEAQSDPGFCVYTSAFTNVEAPRGLWGADLRGSGSRV